MSTKDRLLEMLTSAGDGFVSGEYAADRLGVTRGAVWKNIASLKKDGYAIESVQNRGHRLMPYSDVLSASSVAAYLGDAAPRFALDVRSVTGSTNKDAWLLASAGAPEYTAVIAAEQTEGRGRLGRSFYSPAGTGVYMSVILRPSLPPSDSVFVTAAAAVAVCRAIESLADADAKIKWVNDIYISGLKVCGILAQAAYGVETGGLDFVILGMGINVAAPKGGFPADIKDKAGAVFSAPGSDLRARIAAAVLRSLLEVQPDPGASAVTDEYRSRSMLDGCPVYVISGESRVPATVKYIDSRCRLVVVYGDGSEARLSSGEVTVRRR